MRQQAGHIIVGLLGMFLMCSLQAQTVQQKDRLLAVWEDQARTDTARLQALWHVINDYYGADNSAHLDSSLEYGQALYDFSRETHHLSYTALAASHLGQGFVNKGAYREALPFVEEAIRLNEQLGKEQDLANDYVTLGVISNRMGDVQRAREVYLLAGEIYRNAGDSLNFAASRINLAVTYNATGESEAALGMYLEALEVVKVDSNSPYLLPLMLNLSSLYHSMGDIPNALSYYDQTRQKAEREGNQRILLAVLTRIALLYRESQEYEIARGYLEQAIHLSDSLNFFFVQNDGLRGLTSTYIAEERYAEGLKTAQKGLKLAHKQGDEGAICDFEMFIATCLREMGKLDEAERYMKQAMKRISSPTDGKQGRAYLILAEIYTDKKLWNQARAYAERGIKILQSSANIQEQLSLVGLLVPIYKHFGNTPKALEMLELKQLLSDSLFNAENQRKLIRMEYEYDYRQQAYQDSVQNAASLAIAEEESLRRKTVANFLLAGLFLTLIFGTILLNRFRITSRQKDLIEAEKGKLDQAYSELDEEKNKLSVANGQLRELDDFKSHFFTNISHEFRTPLTVITGMTQQVQQNPQAWLQKGLKLIDRNAQSLLSLVNQILDLRKLESGKLSLQYEQIDAIMALRLHTASFESMAESRSIELHFETKLTELWMDVDREKLRQIAHNLLSNAIKFTPGGGRVSLAVSERSKANIVIEVKDTGRGIPADKLPYIFDRFYQVDRSDTREGEGTGIGLSLTKELVQYMGGEIRVESKEQLGSTFTVSLPIAHAAPVSEVDATSIVPVAVASLDLPLSSSQTEDRPRLLIVEDNPDIVSYLYSLLEEEYVLSNASNGQAGIEMALEQVPDLIITDVMMPRKNGYELTETLKLDERTSHIPIVMLTAKADQDSRLEGYKRGADAYLAKPFDQQELKVRLEKLWEIRQRLQQRYQSHELLPQTEDETEVVEDAFIIRVRTQILAKVDDPTYKRDALGADLGLSNTNLNRKLKALTGLSTGSYIRKVRLVYAKELIKEQPELQIAEVAYATGFNDPAYFSRTFHEEHGLSPVEFKMGKGKT